MGYSQIPLHLPGKSVEDRRDVGWSQFISFEEMCLLPCDHLRQTLRTWTEGLVHMLVSFTHGDITHFNGHCLLTAVEVQVILLTIPGLIMVKEGVVKKGSLLVLDWGIVVFCHVADS